MKHTLITSRELASALEGEEGPVVLDVRSGEAYKRGHLPGAENNCVFEVGFVERVRSVVPEQGASICVYGDNGETHEARMAAEKLGRAGFTRVLELREGLEGWVQSRLPVEGPGEVDPDVLPQLEGRLGIDLGESRIEWIGRNLLNRHRGSIGLQSGELEFQSGRLTGGEFRIDMRAIVCENLQGDPLHDVLIDHLRSDDFFDTALFPEARFRIVAVNPIEGATAGAPDLEIQGELALKDVTRPLAFQAASGRTPEGRFAAQAVFAFDRTHWNVLYGSGRFFRNLGMHLVNDLVEVHLRIVSE